MQNQHCFPDIIAQVSDLRDFQFLPDRITIYVVEKAGRRLQTFQKPC